MRGRGLSKTFENLNMRNITPPAEEEKSSANPRPKSPTKSPKMAARASSKPYDVTATGPGGLVAMLEKLRANRALRQNRDENVMDGNFERQALRENVVATNVTKDSEEDARMSDDTFVTCQGDGRDINNNFANEEARRHQSYTTATDLERKIIRQVEHYFGDYNLPKDKWMLEKLEEECTDGWFDMEAMMTFKRLSSLTQDPSVVLTALAKSPRDLLQIENWGRGKGRVRRNPIYPIPEVNEARRISLQERTLFVWGFDKTATSLDDLIEYFENNFRNVVNIRQRTAPIKDDKEVGMCMQSETEKPRTRQFMGSVFVTFATRQDAEEFYGNWRHRLIFKDRKLKTKWQRDYLNAKAVFNDEFDENTVLRTIYVSGFDKQDTTKEELTQFFLRFKGPVALRKRVFRLETSDAKWQFSGGVFVTFDTRPNAEEFLHLFSDKKLSYNGDSLRVNWQEDFYQEKGLFKQALASLHNPDLDA